MMAPLSEWSTLVLLQIQLAILCFWSCRGMEGKEMGKGIEVCAHSNACSWWPHRGTWRGAHSGLCRLWFISFHECFHSQVSHHENRVVISRMSQVIRHHQVGSMTRLHNVVDDDHVTQLLHYGALFSRMSQVIINKLGRWQDSTMWLMMLVSHNCFIMALYFAADSPSTLSWRTQLAWFGLWVGSKNSNSQRHH